MVNIESQDPKDHLHSLAETVAAEGGVPTETIKAVLKSAKWGPEFTRVVFYLRNGIVPQPGMTEEQLEAEVERVSREREAEHQEVQLRARFALAEIAVTTAYARRMRTELEPLLEKLKTHTPDGELALVIDELKPLLEELREMEDAAVTVIEQAPQF